MKSLSFILSFFLATVSLHAQDYQISFSGTGASTTISTVKVENITQGKSTTLSGTDILHLVTTSTGLDPMFHNNDGLRIYPNPMTENSTIEFISSAAGIAILELFDISGKRIGSAHNTLAIGTNSFEVSGLRSGIYTVSIITQDFTYTE